MAGRVRIPEKATFGGMPALRTLVEWFGRREASMDKPRVPRMSGRSEPEGPAKAESGHHRISERKAGGAPRPPAASRRDSHVRLCSEAAPLLGRLFDLDADDVLDELAEEMMALDARLGRLARAATSLESHARPRPADTASAAAFVAIDGVAAELGKLRAALGGILKAGGEGSVQHVFAGDFSDYLRGTCAWAQAILGALDQLVAELWAGAPEYLRYRSRIDAARNLHFDELEPAIARQLDGSYAASRDERLRGLHGAFLELVAAARRLERQLEAPVTS